jgi:hypothetical protein
MKRQMISRWMMSALVCGMLLMPFKAGHARPVALQGDPVSISLWDAADKNPGPGLDCCNAGQGGSSGQCGGG